MAKKEGSYWSCVMNGEFHFSRKSRSDFLLFFSDVSVSDMAFMVVGVLMGVAFLALIFYGLFHKLYA